MFCCSKRFSTRSTRRPAIVAIEEVYDERRTPDAERLPLMISVTVTDLSGRTLSGQTIDAFWASMRHARPFSVGTNCALGARDMRPYLAELARLADCYVSCYPNAGLPNAFGSTTSCRRTPAGYLHEFATSGFVNIVGGCCGTTPDHIAAIAKAVEGLPPRRRVQTSDLTRLNAFTQFAGLEALTIRPDSNFQMIGERTNVTGSARFARLIRAGDYAAATQRGARAGARRREPHRRQHGRGHARFRAGDDDVPQLHRDGAGNRARAGR